MRGPNAILTTFAALAIAVAGCGDAGSAGGHARGRAEGVTDQSPKALVEARGKHSVTVKPERLPDRIGPASVSSQTTVQVVGGTQIGVWTHPQAPRDLHWTGSIDDQWRAHGQWRARGNDQASRKTYWWHGERVSRREWHRRDQRQ